MKRPVITVVCAYEAIETTIDAVLRPLLLAGSHTLIAVCVMPDGSWRKGPDLHDVSQLATIDARYWLAQSKPVVLTVHGGRLELTVLGGHRQAAHAIDALLPLTALTGWYGSEGLQTRMIGGPSAWSAANRLSMLAMARYLQLPVLPYESLIRHEAADEDNIDADVGRINRSLHYPVQVTPVYTSNNAETVPAPEGLRAVIRAQPLAIVQEMPLEAISYRVSIRQCRGTLQFAEMEHGGQLIPLQPMVLQAVRDLAARAFYGFGCRDIACCRFVLVPAAAVLVPPLPVTGGMAGPPPVQADGTRLYFDGFEPLTADLWRTAWARAGVSNLELVRGVVGSADG